MELQRKDARKDGRYSFLKTIKYICTSDVGRDFKGVTIDMSTSGMSPLIFTARCIREGLHVRVEDEPLLSSKAGTVRWVRQVDHDLYRAGLQFH